MITTKTLSSLSSVVYQLYTSLIEKIQRTEGEEKLVPFGERKADERTTHTY